MKWIDRLTYADIEMSSYARSHEKAKLVIYYYKDRNGVIRKVMELNKIEVESFYEQPDLDDD